MKSFSRDFYVVRFQLRFHSSFFSVKVIEFKKDPITFKREAVSYDLFKRSLIGLLLKNGKTGRKRKINKNNEQERKARGKS